MEHQPTSPGWHPDPSGRHEFRYFNGERWTSDVSVNGRRFVEPPGPPPPPPGWAPAPGQMPNSPTGQRRGLALGAFWVALGSLMIAWIPFIFVIGLAGAITALVLAIVAIRRSRRSEAAGEGFAVAGLVLSIAAICASVVGFLLSGVFLREFDAYANPGAHEVDITRCDTADGLVQLEGAITNLDDRRRSYTITVRYLVDDRSRGADSVRVAAVAAGATVEFRTSELLGADAGDATCVVESVMGPSPFGFRD